MPSSANLVTEVEIYTDGACSGNPGVGAYAAVLMVADHKKEISGAVADTTNNRMELTAAIEALKQLTRPCKVKLYSDSAYVVNAFNNNWLDNWKQNGWKNAAGSAVSNKDLWQALLAEAEKHQLQWIKVKGHADNEYNNRCDELAVQAIKDYKAEHN